MVRTPCCENMGMKKGPWTPEEDQILVSYVQHYGHENWRALPRQAGLLRCGKSCRLRWINYLRPDIKRGNFTKEEEETIINLHQHLGNRWSTIASELPGRTDNEIKNFWHTHLKKKLLRSSTINSTTSTSFNNHKNIGLLISKYEYPINPMNIATIGTNSTNSTSTTVPVQTLAISHAKGQDQPSSIISTAMEDATWKLITKCPINTIFDPTLLLDHHISGTMNNEKRDSEKFDEEMEFWYNLFVKSSGDQSRVLVNGGDHFGCG